MSTPKKYDNFIFFSAGPVGDHLVLIDLANHFFESTKIPSTLVMKHPNTFLRDLSIPYKGHISYIDFIGLRGVLGMLALSLKSIYNRNCYVLVFPVPLPRYLKVFVWYIRFFTRSRVVGFNLEGSKSFPIGKGYASVLGEKNCISMLPETFCVSANRMLSFLGFKEISRVPTLEYVYKEEIFNTLGLVGQSYIVMHVSPSHSFRSLPADRWNYIIDSLIEKIPGIKIVFTGAQNDIPFIEECTTNLSRERCIIAAGKTNAQELLTLYANARMNVTVQTGNGLMVNMLHVPTVVVDIKGTAMFYYDFNEKATILFSPKDCICNPLETSCNMIPYKGKEYMACLFNIDDDSVIDAVLAKSGQK